MYIHVCNIHTRQWFHTFASVKGPEEYDFLKTSFEPVWKQLGNLIRVPYVYVEDKEIIVFGSDYKVCFSVYICNHDWLKQGQLYLCLCLVHSDEGGEVMS